MLDERLMSLLRSLGRSHVLVRHLCEDDPYVKWRLWILDVPLPSLCAVEDEVFDAAIERFGNDPLPVLIGVVSTQRSAGLISELEGKDVVCSVDGDVSSVAL